MNIYKVSRLDDVGYDEFDAIIVYAESQEVAKGILPTFEEYESEHDIRIGCTFYEGHSWASPKNLKAEKIGSSDIAKESGVIMMSFNAG